MVQQGKIRKAGANMSALMALWRLSHEYVSTPSTTVPQSLYTTFGIKYQEQTGEAELSQTFQAKSLLQNYLFQTCKMLSINPVNINLRALTTTPLI